MLAELNEKRRAAETKRDDAIAEARAAADEAASRLADCDQADGHLRETAPTVLSDRLAELRDERGRLLARADAYRKLKTEPRRFITKANDLPDRNNKDDQKLLEQFRETMAAMINEKGEEYDRRAEECTARAARLAAEIEALEAAQLIVDPILAIQQLKGCEPIEKTESPYFDSHSNRRVKECESRIRDYLIFFESRPEDSDSDGAERLRAHQRGAANSLTAMLNTRSIAAEKAVGLWVR